MIRMRVRECALRTIVLVVVKCERVSSRDGLAESSSDAAAALPRVADYRIDVYPHDPFVKINRDAHKTPRATLFRHPSF